MKINKETFGVLATGKKVHLYTLKAGDLELSLSTLGAAWTSLLVPSKSKNIDDILLSYSSLDGYLHNKPYFGVTVGRFAGRISGAKFSLNGKEYPLCNNDNGNSLHGGRVGFCKKVWKAEAYEEKDGVFVRFELESPHGDEGFPGNLKAVVCYGLTKSNEIVADYQATVDAPSPVNFTNHAYFNLTGEGSGDILSTEVKIYSSSCMEIDNSLIPSGKFIQVENTPFDFRTPKPIGRDIDALADTIGGYDHCFLIDGTIGELRPFADVYEPFSGRSIKGFTTQPALQFYTGVQLRPMPGKIGSVYDKFSGFCLETQHFPDSPNRPEFPSCIFGHDRSYHEKAVFAFDW